MQQEMRPIAERDVYHREVDAEWERTRTPLSVLFAVFWGAGMFGVGVLIAWIGGWLSWGDVRLLAVLCGCGSIAAGALTRRWGWESQRKKQHRLIDRLFDGDPNLVAPPPAADEYPFRLLCAMVLSPRVFLAGVLYLGPGGFLFVPHAGHGAAYREPVRIQPSTSIVVNRVPVYVAQRPRWLLGYQAVELLVIYWEGGGAVFTSPEPAETQRRILAQLRRWKFDPPSPQAA